MQLPKVVLDKCFHNVVKTVSQTEHHKNWKSGNSLHVVRGLVHHHEPKVGVLCEYLLNNRVNYKAVASFRILNSEKVEPGVGRYLTATDHHLLGSRTPIQGKSMSCPCSPFDFLLVAAVHLPKSSPDASVFSEPRIEHLANRRCHPGCLTVRHPCVERCGRKNERPVSLLASKNRLPSRLGCSLSLLVGL